MKAVSVLHLHAYCFVHPLSLSVLINFQVYLSRARRMQGPTLISDTLFGKTERHYTTNRGRFDRGCAPRSALPHTMELLLQNNVQAKVMPMVCLV